MSQSVPAGVPPAGRFALAVALFSAVGQTFFIGLFGPDFRAEFGLGESGLGLLYGAATLASGVTMFWLGSIADHLRVTRAVALVIAMLASGAALIAFSPGPAVLLAGIFLVRLAGQGLCGHLAAVAAARYTVRRRGRAVAMATYGFILAEASFPPLVATAMGWLEWRSIWWLAALAWLLAVLPLLWWLGRGLDGREPQVPEDSDESVVGVWSRRELLLDGRFVRVLTVVLVTPMVVTALFLHQGALAERLGWSMNEVASGFVLYAVVQGLAAFATGRLVDHFSARAMLRFVLLPIAGGVLALGLAPPDLALWLMFAGLGLTAGCNFVASGAVWVELFGSARLGMIRGVYAALMVLSTAAGPVIFGWLLDRQVSLLAVGIALAVWVAAVSVFAVGRLHRRT